MTIYETETGTQARVDWTGPVSLALVSMFSQVITMSLKVFHSRVYPSIANSSSYACCCPSLIATHPTLFICVAKGQHRQLELPLPFPPNRIDLTWLCRNLSSINYHDWTYWLNRLYKTPRPNIFEIVCWLFIDRNICPVIDPLFTSNLSCSKNL